VSGLEYLGKALVVLGGITLGVGLLILGLGKLVGGGRFLPGDIVIQRPGFTFVLPIVTCLALSAAATIILWLLLAWRR